MPAPAVGGNALLLEHRDGGQLSLAREDGRVHGAQALARRLGVRRVLLGRARQVVAHRLGALREALRPLGREAERVRQRVEVVPELRSTPSSYS